MSRLLLAFAGIVLLVVTALGVLWLAGEVLVGAGLLAVGTAGVLLRLLWFLVLAAVLGGAVYFIADAWRPAGRAVSRVRPGPSGRAETVTVSAQPQLVITQEPLTQDDSLMGRG